MLKKKPVVFIVEDDKDVAYLIQDVLEQQGADCVIATAGEAVVDRAVELQPALILLDIRLPGIDGYTVCRRLKRNSEVKHIPVVFISALNTEDDVLEAHQAGGVYYISKPFDIDFLIRKVKEILSLVVGTENREMLSVERLVLYVNASYTVGTDQFLDPVRRYLSESEFKLAAIEDPQETLRSVRQLRPDLILLDVDQGNVPVDTLLEVLVNHPTTRMIPMVVISDLFALHAGAASDMPNVKAVLPKPVDELQLLSALRNVALAGF